ncbi:ribosome maturation factor RimM [uncultured Enorma sp.]|uniref:ribosome maturation factor RimM n=1 Tax=uncultured Enorma sp. TaxID=1714346 RepID=UPI002592485E|nr:16S rRNA processing protein RimM [uncultured Enorma sp.]
MNIARVVRPHGRAGEVIVRPVRGLPFCIEPGLEVALTPPALGRDRFCRVEAVADDPQGGRVRFSGIDTIDAAEAVRDCYVLARRNDVELGALDAPWEELLGRHLADARFGDLGAIAQVIETPANDVWQVEGAFGEVLVPVIEQVVREIPETGDIPVRIMDGLIDPALLPRASEQLADEPETVAHTGEGEGACS